MDYGTEGEVMNLEEDIARMEQELADMKRQLEEQKKCKLEMEPAEWYIGNAGHAGKGTTTKVNETQKFGMKRHTKELAEISAKRMKQANLLEYWAMAIDPDWRDRGIGTNAWYVWHTNADTYQYGSCSSYRSIGQVYMSEKAAREIADALNSGELVL